nr:hypothetical protein [Xanthomonadales bacterium]
RKHRPRLARFVVSALLIALGGCDEADPPLPPLPIDAARISVSGISSGAYMAHQVHLVFSRSIHGAALIAGGPYGCARGDLQTALADCMNPTTSSPDVPMLAAEVRARAAAGRIDALAGLEGDRVLVVHGRADGTVAAAVSATTTDLYRRLADTVEVTQDDDRDFAHVFPMAMPGECVADDAHMAACGIDLAGEILRHLADAQAEAATTARGDLLAFDQRAYAEDDHDPRLSDRGYLYVPPQCREQACGLHVAFHGCEMQADRIGTRFVAEAGYNRWADSVGVVVLYPQVRSSLMPLNPKACWDWWGYTGRDYDTRDGAQMRWLMRVFAHFGVVI